MDKLLRILLLVVFVSNNLYAQTPAISWVKQIGANSYEAGYNLGMDGAGNTYVTGCFSSTITIGTFTLNAAAIYDHFIAKYDPSGNVLWAKKAGAPSGFDFGYSLDVDSAGYVYLCGGFQGVAYFGSSVLYGAGYIDGFIAKYSPSGTPMWARGFGTPSWERCNSITVDKSGDCYFTGEFTDSIAIGSTSLQSQGHFDLFIAKYSSGGQPLWVKQAGGSGPDRSIEIIADKKGNCFVAGYVGGNTGDIAHFDSISLPMAGNIDIFLTKYDTSGNAVWANLAGGINSDAAAGIGIDSLGNCYVGGWICNNQGGTASFDTITLSSNGDGDVFLAKYDSAGNLVWAKHAGGLNGDYGQAFSVDKDGNSYVGGSFFGTATFDSSTIVSNGDYDMYTAKYDTNGNMKWIISAGGIEKDQAFDIIADQAGNCYVTGGFGFNSTSTATINFGGTTLTSNGGTDLFLVKIGSSVTSVQAAVEQTLDLSVHPNPADSYVAISSAGLQSIRLFDTTGRLVKHELVNADSVVITLKGLAPGLYTLLAQTVSGLKRSKLVIE